MSHVSSQITEISYEIKKLKLAAVCAKCAGIEDLHRLTNCGDLICTPCLNAAASKCPVCSVSIIRRDSLTDNYLQDVIKNIYELSKVNQLEQIGGFNFESPRIIPFFAPETAINKRDHKGETRLHKECRDGNIDKVEARLQTGVDINVQDFAGWTALHEAVRANKVNVVKLLLDYGAFVNVPGLNYMTPLHVAVEENNIPITKLLVEYGSSLMSYNKSGKTPMNICKITNDMMNALCLTPRQPYMYKVYNIPQPKVFFINVSAGDRKKLNHFPGVGIITERIYLNEGNATYVIIGDDKPNTKHLQAAILQGSCIVITKWIDDYIEKKSSVNPMEYIPKIPGYALDKAIMNMFNKLPKLFDGLHFYFFHTNVQKIGGYQYKFDDFKTLIHLGGGKIITRHPVRIPEQDLYYPYHADINTKSATTTHYVIYDATIGKPTEKGSTGIMYKSAKWVIGCINTFSIRT